MSSHKKEYKAPETMEMRVNPEGVICQSANSVMIWSLTDPYSITSNAEAAEWDRGSYGAADEL